MERKPILYYQENITLPAPKEESKDLALKTLNQHFGFLDGKIPFESKTTEEHLEATYNLFRSITIPVTVILYSNGDKEIKTS